MKMKKILLCLACGTAITGLASCSKTVTNSAYGADLGGTYDTYIYCTTVTQTGAKMNSVEIEEVPMVSKWARLSASSISNATEDKDYITVNNVDDGNKDESGNTKLETIYFAKHIRIGSTTWTASKRSEDPTSGYKSEYSVVYTLDTSKSAGDGLDSDLIRYLNADVDTGRYKIGSRFQWYFDAVINNNIKILKEDTRTEASNLTNGYTFTYKDESEGWDAYYSKDSLKRSKWDSDWATGVSALESFCVNTLKKINYIRRVTDDSNNNHYTVKKNNDGTWCYNPNYSSGMVWDDDNDNNLVGYIEITGLTTNVFARDSVTALFTGINIAYAAGEYTSQR